MRRRTFSALALAAAALPAPFVARAAAPVPVRVTLPGSGSAGSIWRPLFAALPPEVLDGIDLQWIGGNPGQLQMQLVAGTLDVGVFGALGLAEMAARGSDIVIFGPALNNHGRWLVPASSPYQKPEDLIGKRIAALAEASETFKAARIASAVSGIDIRREMSVVFGPPTANQALFERGDVDGILTLEPSATRLIGQGAREIARVGDLWRRGTGETEVPFLVGLAAQRRWVEQNRAIATQLARAFVIVNRITREDPARVASLHGAFGIRETERKAIELLPSRLADVYGVAWNDTVFASIDRQIEVARGLGLIPALPDRPLYDRTPLTGA
nr:ABC transporter substrate-binding protein [uncultured Roseococcus sp.]